MRVLLHVLRVPTILLVMRGFLVRCPGHGVSNLADGRGCHFDFIFKLQMLTQGGYESIEVLARDDVANPGHRPLQPNDCLSHVVDLVGFRSELRLALRCKTLNEVY